MKLHELAPAKGSKKAAVRVGRGNGSGCGKTSGRGQKGQWARSGGGVRPGFEGGQMPLIRRSPKRGFNNNFRKVYATVNVGMLNGFEANSVIDYDVLYGEGLIKETKNAIGLKVLGDGELKVALTVKAKAFSASAKEAIEKAGGTVEIL